MFPFVKCNIIFHFHSIRSLFHFRHICLYRMLQQDLEVMITAKMYDFMCSWLLLTSLRTLVVCWNPCGVSASLMNAQTVSAYLEYNQPNFYLVICTSPWTVEERISRKRHPWGLTATVRIWLIRPQRYQV